MPSETGIYPYTPPRKIYYGNKITLFETYTKTRRVFYLISFFNLHDVIADNVCLKKIYVILQIPILRILLTLYNKIKFYARVYEVFSHGRFINFLNPQNHKKYAIILERGEFK